MATLDSTSDLTPWPDPPHCKEPTTTCPAQFGLWATKLWPPQVAAWQKVARIGAAAQQGLWWDGVFGGLGTPWAPWDAMWVVTMGVPPWGPGAGLLGCQAGWQPGSRAPAACLTGLVLGCLFTAKAQGVQGRHHTPHPPQKLWPSSLVQTLGKASLRLGAAAARGRIGVPGVVGSQGPSWAAKACTEVGHQLWSHMSKGTSKNGLRYH